MNSNPQPAVKNTFDIYHDLPILASSEKVYDAITLPEQLEKWWPKKCSGIPKLGEEYNFYFTDAYDWYGKVIKAEKNRSFHIQMTKSDPDWDQTSFGFDLKEIENGMRVQFKHTGWPFFNDHYRTSFFCWAILLNGLKDYVEKGVVIPFEERE